MGKEYSVHSHPGFLHPFPKGPSSFKGSFESYYKGYCKGSIGLIRQFRV